MPRAAVFLDRDGVINEERSFITRCEQLVLLPGVVAAIRALNAASLPAVVVTNQSAIARGMMTEEELSEIHDCLRRLLEAEGAVLDGIFYSPVHPDADVAAYRRESECRKPGPGLLIRAAQELDLDLGESFLVGDSLRDIAAAQAAGLKAAYLVRTGHGARELVRLEADPLRTLPKPDAVFDNLAEAAGHILNHLFQAGSR